MVQGQLLLLSDLERLGVGVGIARAVLIESVIGKGDY